MKLSEYCDKYNVNKKKFAKSIGVLYSTFYNACNGFDIYASIARKIIAGCHGEVTLEELELNKKRPSRKKLRRVEMSINNESKDSKD